MAKTGTRPRARRLDHVARGEASEGYSPILDGRNAQLRDLSVGRLRIDSKGTRTYRGRTGGTETLLHILVGRCTIETSGPWGRRAFKNLGDRQDVFSAPPTSLVLGPKTEYRVTPITRTVDIAVASLPIAADRLSSPALIRPQDVPVHQIGEGHYTRTVREVIGGEGPAVRMRAGETINPTGLWSSWPHHDFDANPKLAPKFEEVFLYFTKPRSGWGLQRRTGLYCNLDRVDDVIVVRNGDAAVLPLGDHPVVAGVDSQVLYVWFYVSPIPKIYSKWAEDLGGYA
jgi:5-deoxy-glucuronate isomerase